MTHMFEVEIAERYGLQEAIILGHLHYWILKNKANGVNFHDGKWWTYNSVKAFCELFPYMSTSTINRVLTRLEEEGLVVTGNYNRAAYDRTKWYALTEKAEALFANPAGAQKTETETAAAESAKRKKEYSTEFETFWESYPRNTDKGSAYRAYCARLNDGYSPAELIEAARAYASQCRRENTEMKYIKQAKTFLGPATPFVDYLDAEKQETVGEVSEDQLNGYKRFLESLEKKA